MLWRRITERQEEETIRGGRYRGKMWENKKLDMPKIMKTTIKYQIVSVKKVNLPTKV